MSLAKCLTNPTLTRSGDYTLERIAKNSYRIWKQGADLGVVWQNADGSWSLHCRSGAQYVTSQYATRRAALAKVTP